MNGTRNRRLERIGGWSLSRRGMVLLSSALSLFAVLLPVAYHTSATDGVAALGVAAAACLMPALLALLIGELLPGTEWALPNLGIGMMLRMGIPLGTCVVVYASRGPLAEAGMACYLLIFYPVLLSVETGLMLSRNAYLRHISDSGGGQEEVLTQSGET